MALTGDSTLVVADDLSILRADGTFQLTLRRRRLRCERYTMAVLEAFGSPTTMRQGIDQVESRAKGAHGWVELVAHVKALHELGVLVKPGAEATARRAHDTRFDSAPVHIRMLDDAVRTSAFQQAIRSTVTPEDVVLDIGTGTGVLAVTAAFAGARHVYGVEASTMGRAAQRLADANGVADRVTIVSGHSFDVDLPERATVLVSEIIGDDPLAERILPTFADARARLLTDDARVIPSRLRIHALPLEVPTERMKSLRFTNGHAETWGKRYEMDFSGLVAVSDEQAHRVSVNSYETRTWKRLAEPALLADVDLVGDQPEPTEQEVTLPVTTAGSLTGLLVFFDAQLARAVHLSLHPDAASPSNSWGNLLHVLARPLDVVVGDTLRLRYRDVGRGSELDLDRL